MPWGTVGIVVLLFDLFIIYLVLKSRREPLHKLLWVIVVLALPVLGALLYLLVGRTRPLI